MHAQTHRKLTGHGRDTDKCSKLIMKMEGTPSPIRQNLVKYVF